MGRESNRTDKGSPTAAGGSEQTVADSVAALDATVAPSSIGTDATVAPSSIGTDATVAPSSVGTDATVAPSSIGTDATVCPDGVDAGDTLPGPDLGRTRPPARTAPGLGVARQVPDADANLTHEHPGRYQIAEELGAGGIGRVLRAFDRHLGREVAIKELQPAALPHGSNSGHRTVAEVRFLGEARITGRLEHPAIVPVYELGKRRDGSLYYAMRVVQGRTLTEALAGKALAERLALLPAFVDLCNAVAFAHSRGVIHRDLKPDNVMLGEFGETVVLDWGLAKVRGDGDAGDIQGQRLAGELAQLKQATGAETLAGGVFGTPAYMPPEQAEGRIDQIDERSDVYSLGAILYTMLCGRAPFDGETVGLLLERVREGRLVPPTERERSCPGELAAIAERALAKDPAARYVDARALAADVSAFLTGGLVGAHRYSPWQLLAHWIRRHLVPLALSALILVVAAGAWWYRGRTEQRARQVEAAARRAQIAARVDAILAETAKGSGQPRWFEVYTAKLISLKHPVVEQRLIAALSHEQREVRRLAARALGGMGSRAAVPALVARLRAGAEPVEAVTIEVINTLGVIGDWHADAAVLEARWRGGQHGPLWKATELAYRMIPLPPLPAGGLSAEQWLARGRAFLNKNDNTGARDAFDRALQREPGMFKALNNRGIAKKRLGDLKGSLADFDAALRGRPQAAEPLQNRSLIKVRLGDYAGAIADLDRVIDAGKGGASALRMRARARRYLRDIDNAVADLERAAGLDRKGPASYGMLGTLRLEQGDFARALAAYDRALALDDSYLDGLLNRALVHQIKPRPDLEAAIHDLDRALSIDPTHASARRQRANVRLLRGDRAGAKRDLDRSIELAPAEALRWGLRAAIYHAPRGDYAAALADMQQALRRAPSEADKARYRLFALLLARRAPAGEAQARALTAALARPVVLGEKGRTRWANRLLGLYQGRLAVADLQGEMPGFSAHRCELALVQGLVAEMAGAAKAARGHYAAARQVRRPNDMACALARALAASRR